MCAGCTYGHKMVAKHPSDECQDLLELRGGGVSIAIPVMTTVQRYHAAKDTTLIPSSRKMRGDQIKFISITLDRCS